jgi:hypothetical protein
MVESVEKPSGISQKGKPWAKVKVLINGDAYEGFLPQWERLSHSEGQYWRIDWQPAKFGSGRDITEAEMIPGGILEGLDTRPTMQNKDIIIARENANNASAVVIASMVGFGMFTNKDDVYMEWDKMYRFVCSHVGVEPTDD